MQTHNNLTKSLFKRSTNHTIKNTRNQTDSNPVSNYDNLPYMYLPLSPNIEEVYNMYVCM